jgi:hypothetical protein
MAIWSWSDGHDDGLHDCRELLTALNPGPFTWKWITCSWFYVQSCIHYICACLIKIRHLKIVVYLIFKKSVLKSWPFDLDRTAMMTDCMTAGNFWLHWILVHVYISSPLFLHAPKFQLVLAYCKTNLTTGYTFAFASASASASLPQSSIIRHIYHMIHIYYIGIIQ